MKRKFLILFTVLFFLSEFTFAQKPDALIEKGNQSFYEKDYNSALKYYINATIVDKSHQFTQSIYNTGNTFYLLKKYDDAIKKYNEFISVSASTELKAQAQFNIGNCYLIQNDLPKCIAAFENALKLNPKDADTRYNLTYAISKLNGRQKKEDDTNDQGKPNPVKNKKEKPQPENQNMSKEDLDNLLKSLSQAESNTLNGVSKEQFRTNKKKSTKNW